MTVNHLRCEFSGALKGMPIVELNRLNPCPQPFMDSDTVMPPSVPPPPRVYRKKIFLSLLVIISVEVMVNDTTLPFFPTRKHFIVTSRKANCTV